MDKKQLVQLTQRLNQPQLLDGVDTLPEKEIFRFYQQLAFYGEDVLLRQRKMASESKEFSLANGHTPPFLMTSASLRQMGSESAKTAGCVILAGGMGSRLGFNGPKGMCHISPVMQKTLFQILFEKIHCLSRLLEHPLHVAIMVCSKNQHETTSYLQQHNFFGIDSAYVSIICQNDLPLLSTSENWLLEAPGILATGPDGNGGVFKVLEHSGVLDLWMGRGVKHLSVVQVDNPLAQPFDLDLLGACVKQDSEVSVKVVKRSSAEESVGVVASFESRLHVVEYSDLSSEQKGALDPFGELLFPLANTGIMCFSLSFVQRALRQMQNMPWHIAKKTALIFNSSQSIHSENVLKFESFIFDIFPLAKSFSVVCSPREQCYSPLKNKEGDKGLYSVQRDLLATYKKMYFALSGIAPPDRDFELGESFWYPNAEMQDRWRGRPLPDLSYIER